MTSPPDFQRCRCIKPFDYLYRDGRLIRIEMGTQTTRADRCAQGEYAKYWTNTKSSFVEKSE